MAPKGNGEWFLPFLSSHKVFSSSSSSSPAPLKQQEGFILGSCFLPQIPSWLQGNCWEGNSAAVAKSCLGSGVGGCPKKVQRAPCGATQKGFYSPLLTPCPNKGAAEQEEGTGGEEGGQEQFLAEFWGLGSAGRAQGSEGCAVPKSTPRISQLMQLLVLRRVWEQCWDVLLPPGHRSIIPEQEGRSWLQPHRNGNNPQAPPGLRVCPQRPLENGGKVQKMKKKKSFRQHCQRRKCSNFLKNNNSVPLFGHGLCSIKRKRGIFPLLLLPFLTPGHSSGLC